MDGAYVKWYGDQVWNGEDWSTLSLAGEEIEKDLIFIFIYTWLK